MPVYIFHSMIGYETPRHDQLWEELVTSGIFDVQPFDVLYLYKDLLQQRLLVNNCVIFFF